MTVFRLHHSAAVMLKMRLDEVTFYKIDGEIKLRRLLLLAQLRWFASVVALCDKLMYTKLGQQFFNKDSCR